MTDQIKTSSASYITDVRINWDKINPVFANTMRQVLGVCFVKHNINMIPTFGIRTLSDQAKLWRQSRSSLEINQEIQKLKASNCDYLANILISVGPQNGPHVTNSLPGLSWHNWGEAIDCLAFVNNTPIMSGDAPEYATYAQVAVDYGLTAGDLFKSFKDAGHVQLRKQEILDLYTIKEVNDHFQVCETGREV